MWKVLNPPLLVDTLFTNGIIFECFPFSFVNQVIDFISEYKFQAAWRSSTWDIPGN